MTRPDSPIEDFLDRLEREGRLVQRATTSIDELDAPLPGVHRRPQAVHPLAPEPCIREFPEGVILTQRGRLRFFKERHGLADFFLGLQLACAKGSAPTLANPPQIPTHGGLADPQYRRDLRLAHVTQPQAEDAPPSRFEVAPLVSDGSIHCAWRRRPITVKNFQFRSLAIHDLGALGAWSR
jgi:hypothetical protein